jgi:adenylosuccinate synthase
MSGWSTPTQGVTDVDQLPKAAREYLTCIEKERGARVGMISTGPGRDETIFTDTFTEELNSITDGKSRAQMRS